MKMWENIRVIARLDIRSGACWSWRDSNEPKINSLGLAYIAFNTFDSVDLAIDEEKPNNDNCHVY